MGTGKIITSISVPKISIQRLIRGLNYDRPASAKACKGPGQILIVCSVENHPKWCFLVSLPQIPTGVPLASGPDSDRWLTSRHCISHLSHIPRAMEVSQGLTHCWCVAEAGLGKNWTQKERFGGEDLNHSIPPQSRETLVAPELSHFGGGQVGEGWGEFKIK